MKKPIKKQILNRMNYAFGHFEGVKKMIEGNKYCIDIILQNEAVISAIKKVNEIILENHLNNCMAQAIKDKNEKKRKEKIKELLKLFRGSHKTK